MLAGRLKHRLEIQTESTTLDVYGEPTSGWSTDETVWAALEPISGTERDIGEGLAGIVSHRVLMRYTANATPKKRLKYGARIFGIESVLNHDEKNAHLRIFCKEQVD